MRMIRQFITIVGAGFTAVIGSVSVPAVAQVTYAPRAVPYDPFLSPFVAPFNDRDVTHPSYQIGSDVYGRTVVQVVRRCAYPNGWNVGDFSREYQGTPLGIGHTCPDPEPPLRSRPRY